MQLQQSVTDWSKKSYTEGMFVINQVVVGSSSQLTLNLWNVVCDLLLLPRSICEY